MFNYGGNSGCSYSLADIAAATGNGGRSNNDDGWGGGNGAWQKK